MKTAHKNSDIIREYVRKLGEDDLKFLQIRLAQRIGSDVAEAVEIMQKNPEMDRWLSMASSASDFFDIIDSADHAVQQEIKRRCVSYEQKARV